MIRVFARRIALGKGHGAGEAPRGKSRRWQQPLRIAIAVLVATSAVYGVTRAAETTEVPAIDRLLVTELKDLKLTAVRKEVNIEELRRIDPDYANAYRVGRSTIMLKEPDKFRMDARAGFIKFEYVISGPRRVMRAPLIRQIDEIGVDPGKRQGPLEVGLVTPGCLRGYEVAQVARTQVGDRPAYQYRLTYAHDHERYELVWIDAERKHILKRKLWTKFQGEYKLELTFLKPKQFGDIWIPTRVEVRNARGALAGVTEQSDITVNGGLDDKLFEL